MLTIFWLVLISSPFQGRRLSWPGCVVTYQDGQWSHYYWVQHGNVPSVLWHCWLGSRKDIPHPACKNWVEYWHGYLSGARCKGFAYGPADATATPSSLAPVKSRMVYLSGAGWPWLSWKKGRQMDVVVVVQHRMWYLCYCTVLCKVTIFCWM